MPKGEHRKGNGVGTSKHGYLKVRVGVDHPLADPNGWAYLHHLVWKAAGYKLPRETEIYDVLHHRNDDKTDNRIGNLELKTRAEHNRHHNRARTRDGLGRFQPTGVSQ